MSGLKIAWWDTCGEIQWALLDFGMSPTGSIPVALLSHAHSLSQQKTFQPKTALRIVFLPTCCQKVVFGSILFVGQTKALFEAQYGEYPPLQRIERVVTQQCRRAT